MQRPELDALPVGVLLADDAFELRSASSQFLRDFDCELPDIEGLELTELISSRDRRSMMKLDRALNGAAERVDMIAVLEVGEREHLARLLITPRGEELVILVERLEGAGSNTVHELFVEHRRWSAGLKSTSDGLAFVDEDLKVTDYNARFVELLALRSEHGVLLAEACVAGRPLPALLSNEAFAGILALLEGDAGAPLHELIELQGRHLEIEMRPLYLPPRGLAGHAIALRDVSDRVQAEREREARQRDELEHQRAIIAVQRAAIRELTAPRIPLSRELTVVPLVGTLDGQRIVEITEDLLEGVSRDKTRSLVLDLTGVPELDAVAARGLLGATRALNLLGVRTVLTGISPSIAQRLASDDSGFGGLEIRATLEAAIAHVNRPAMRRR